MSSSIFKHHLLIAALFIFFILQLVQSNEDQEMQPSTIADGTSTYVPRMGCGMACKARCRLSSRPNLCKRACGTCCARCSCVPPGTSGNQKLCPCYYAITTHGGRRKCP